MGEREIFHTEQENISIVFTNGEWKVKEQHRESGMGIRVLENGRLGFAHGPAGTETRIEANARQMTSAAPRTNFSFGNDSGESRATCTDDRISALEIEGLHGMLKQVQDGAKDAEHVRIYAHAEQGTTRIENPHFQKGYAHTQFSLYVEATNGDGMGHYSCHGTGLPSMGWWEIGKEAADRARAMQQAQKPSSGKYNVVFAPEALHDVLGLLLPSFSGDWKRRGMTRLQIGQSIADERLSIYDDGTAQASHARPWDDEGTPARPIPLIEKGVVKDFQYDRYTAALEGISGGESCSRSGYATSPGIGGSNTILTAGTDTWEEPHLYIRALHGMHTANTTTGDFGAEVSAASWMERGTETPMRGFLITENIFNLLNTIKGIGRTRNTYSNLVAPPILFSDVQVVR